MSEVILKTTDLVRQFDKQQSVSNLNMNVIKGNIYGFLGPNGAGKTTTIRMLLGLIRPTSGQVRIFGQDMPKDRYTILNRIGSLVECPSYYGHLSGYENLEVIAKLLDVSSKRIYEVLDIVRLSKEARKTVKAYSLGMKQRLGIAAALLNNPEMLILDEPTNGLDPSGIHEIRELIISLPKQFGITVLVSSHLLSEIDQMATQVGIINEGKLIFEDNIDVLRLKSSPKLYIETDRPFDVQKLLQTSGNPAEIEDNTVVLSQVEYNMAAEINKMIVLAGFSVYRLRETKPSLESIFLSLVGKGGSL